MQFLMQANPQMLSSILTNPYPYSPQFPTLIMNNQVATLNSSTVNQHLTHSTQNTANQSHLRKSRLMCQAIDTKQNYQQSTHDDQNQEQNRTLAEHIDHYSTKLEEGLQQVQTEHQSALQSDPPALSTYESLTKVQTQFEPQRKSSPKPSASTSQQPKKRKRCVKKSDLPLFANHATQKHLTLKQIVVICLVDYGYGVTQLKQYVNRYCYQLQAQAFTIKVNNYYQLVKMQLAKLINTICSILQKDDHYKDKVRSFKADEIFHISKFVRYYKNYFNAEEQKSIGDLLKHNVALMKAVLSRHRAYNLYLAFVDILENRIAPDDQTRQGNCYIQEPRLVDQDQPDNQIPPQPVLPIEKSPFRKYDKLELQQGEIDQYDMPYMPMKMDQSAYIDLQMNESRKSRKIQQREMYSQIKTRQMDPRLIDRRQIDPRKIDGRHTPRQKDERGKPVPRQMDGRKQMPHLSRQMNNRLMCSQIVERPKQRQMQNKHMYRQMEEKSMYRQGEQKNIYMQADQKSISSQREQKSAYREEKRRMKMSSVAEPSEQKLKMSTSSLKQPVDEKTKLKLQLISIFRKFDKQNEWKRQYKAMKPMFQSCYLMTQFKHLLKQIFLESYYTFQSKLALFKVCFLNKHMAYIKHCILYQKIIMPSFRRLALIMLDIYDQKQMDYPKAQAYVQRLKYAIKSTRGSNSLSPLERFEYERKKSQMGKSQDFQDDEEQWKE